MQYVCVFCFVSLGVNMCVCGFSSTEAEELYQRRVLTITGICVALLVVGIVCVVAYCKTKYVTHIKDKGWKSHGTTQ